MITDKELIESYLQRRQQEGLAERSVSAYRNDLRQFFDYLQEKSVAILEIKTFEIHLFLSHLEVNVSRSSYVRKLSTIRKFFQFLEQEGHVIKNPWPILSASRVVRQKPFILSRQQIAKLISAPLMDKSFVKGKKNHTILLLLYETGMKAGELSLLRKSDIDWQHQALHVGKAKRTIPISSSVISALQQYLSLETQTSEILFLNNRGVSYSIASIGHIVRKYGGQIGVSRPVHPQMIRDSHIVHQIEDGIDPLTLKDHLGFASIAGLEIYF